MKPYLTKRGNMPYYLRCTWANGHVSELMVDERHIEDWGTSPQAAQEYAEDCISVRRGGIERVEVCDQSGVLRRVDPFRFQHG